LIFKFISAVVEEYLAPAISYISEWLNLSEALAAVTLLALANGAGDVITALVASGSSDGLSYNIGSIYGAGFVLIFLNKQYFNSLLLQS
jgi:sodium/potassium/calcium exchanger 6